MEDFGTHLLEGAGFTFVFFCVYSLVIWILVRVCDDL